ncbi:hypothetical protein L345_15836, partial [Ophiophagus hannah]
MDRRRSGERSVVAEGSAGKAGQHHSEVWKALSVTFSMMMSISLRLCPCPCATTAAFQAISDKTKKENNFVAMVVLNVHQERFPTRQVSMTVLNSTNEFNAAIIIDGFIEPLFPHGWMTGRIEFLSPSEYHLLPYVMKSAILATVPPLSLCNDPCQSGYRKTKKEGEKFCCYDCAPCPKRMISSQKDMENCI